MVSGVDGSDTGRSNPAVRRGSRSADSRHFDRRRGDRDLSLPAVKSTRVETLRAVLRAKGHSREAADMMSRSLRDSSIQVYESYWARFVSFCRFVKMACVPSQKSSFQHLYDASIQRQISPSDNNFTSHLCGFCITSLGLWSSSRSAHQATHQSFQPGTSGATQNYAQVGPSSCAFIFIETAFRIGVRYSRGILWWRHSLKMTDHENCVPASIGFGETALISARIECLGRQVCVLERSHPATSFAGATTDTSGVLEVIWSLPEFVSTRHDLYRWWHVDTGSSGGRTTSSGSRTSSPSSIAYTICIQPLLQRS